jgi:hypothetical protein
MFNVQGRITGKALAIFDETGDQNIFVASASGTTRRVLTIAGYLGIGTTSPSTLTHVNGGVLRVTNASSSLEIDGNQIGCQSGLCSNPWYIRAANSESNGSQIEMGQGDQPLRFRAGSYYQADIQFYTSGASKMVIKGATGNVGIGTTAPTSKLHVTGAVTGKALAIFDETGDQNILVASASGVTKFTLDRNGAISAGAGTFTGAFSPNGGVTGSIVIGAQYGFPIQAGRSTSISIGNYSGGGDYTPTRVINIGTSAGGGWAVTGSDNINIGYNAGGTTTGAVSNSIFIGANAGYNASQTTTPSNSMALGYNTYTTASNQFVYGNSSVTQHLFESGNVGIGTTAPTSKLHVSGAVTGKSLAILDETGDQNIFTASASGITKFIIQHDGKVGIGTTSPTGALAVNGGTGSLGTGIVFGNGGTGLYESTDNNLYIEATGGSIVMRTSGNGWMMFTEGGNVSYKPLNVQSTFSVTGGSSHYISSGNFGVGTNSPTSKLHVSGAVTGKALAIFDETGDQNIFTASASGTPKVVITHSGYVGIGTTSPSDLFVTQTGSNPGIKFTAAQGANAGNISIKAGGDSTNQIYTSGTWGEQLNYVAGGNKSAGYGHVFRVDNTLTEIMRIEGNARVGIGTTAPIAALHVTTRSDAANFHSGKAAFVVNQVESQDIMTASASGVTKFTIGNDGTVTTTLGTGTVYSNAGVLTNTDPSDINLKQNVLTLSDGTLGKVLGLRAVSYEWKRDGSGALGFIAQEVKSLFPELVGSNADGSLGLYTTQFIPVLTKAIQEQQLQIDEIKLSSASANISQNAWLDLVALIDTISAKIEEWSNKFTTKQLCVNDETGEVCITKTDLQKLLDNLPSPSPSPTASASATPEPSLVPLSSVSPSLIPSPTATDSAILSL